jgi:dTDP-4-dehydrorhamnose reductase
MIPSSLVSRVLILGAGGQVGDAWQNAVPHDCLAAALDRTALDISEIDALTDRMQSLIEQHRPTLIVNAAAYTAVDLAEEQQALAYDVNALAPGVMATVAASVGIPLIHYSTDYVFDGHGEQPFTESDTTNPLSVYGRSKLAGERAVQAAGGAHLILRTSWVFSSHGQNFLKTMLRLATSRDALRVVNDQIGAPTPAHLLAEVPMRMVSALQGLADPRWGLYHLCPTGQTSWHGYACYLIAKARELGWPIQLSDEHIEGITSAQFPTKAARPYNSRLSTAKLRQAFGLVLPDWREGVDRVLQMLEVPA